MTHVDVILLPLPRLLADLLEDLIAAHSGLRVAARARDARSAAAAALRLPGPVVVIGGPAAASPTLLELTYELPRMRLVSIAEGGRQASLHELRLIHAPLGEVAPSELLRLIRTAPGTCP